MGFSTLISIIIGIIGLAVGYAIRKYISEGKLKNAEELSKKIIYDAENQAQTQKKMLLVEAKEEIQKLRSEQENEAKLRRAEIKELEDNISKKEEKLENLQEELCKEEIYSNPEESERVNKEIKIIQENIEKLYEEWELLSE